MRPAAITAALETPASPAVTASPWIISRAADLGWFQGSVVAGLALVACFALLPALDDGTYTLAHPAVLLLLAWGVFFDGTHVFGTYARTYLSPNAAAREALPGRAAWLIVLVGPALAWFDAQWCEPGPSLLGHAGWLFRSFLLFAYLWAYWHLVRQHYGFLALYRRREPASAARIHLDTVALWLGCLYPYLRFSLSAGYAHSGLPQLLTKAVADLLRPALDAAFATALLALAAYTIARRPRLGPRHSLVVIVVSFHLLVFAVLDNLLVITAALTIFHNLQYHRIVWQYERAQGRRPTGNALRYLVLGTLFGLAWYGPRTLGVALVDSDLARNLLLGLGWGVAFHHYYVDARIWRVRRGALTQTLDHAAQAQRAA